MKERKSRAHAELHAVRPATPAPESMAGLSLNAIPPTTRKSMKAQVVGYWSCTVLVGLSFLSGGAADLLRPPPVVEGMTHLGYPAYFMLVGAAARGPQAHPFLSANTVIAPLLISSRDMSSMCFAIDQVCPNGSRSCP